MDTVTVIAVPAVIVGVPLILWLLSVISMYIADDELDEEDGGQRHERKW